MRVWISLDPETLAEFDRRAGEGQRDAFIAKALRATLEDDRRRREIEAELEASEGGEAGTGSEPRRPPHPRRS